jgi:hypothetical protein
MGAPGIGCIGCIGKMVIGLAEPVRLGSSLFTGARAITVYTITSNPCIFSGVMSADVQK